MLKVSAPARPPIASMRRPSRTALRPVKRLIADHDAGRLKGEKLTPESISRRLYHPDMPDPDLIIRTSGEERISNFLLWQAAYSELYFTPVYWPDFDREHLYEAVRDFQKRSRRFGAIAENDSD